MVSTTHNIDPKSRDNRQAETHRFTKQSKAKKHRFSGVVRVVPRKKTMGQEKIERNADCVEVTIHKIKALSHLSQTNAAKELGLSVTALKHACRTLGYHKWPRDYETSGTVSPAEISEQIPRASTKTSLPSIDVSQGPTVDVAMHPCDIAKRITFANSSQETESKESNLLGSAVETSQLQHQDSFRFLGLGLNPFVEEKNGASDSFARMLAAGKEQPDINKDVDEQNQDLFQRSVLDDKNENEEVSHVVGDLEWEDNLQDLLYTMEQADERHDRHLVFGMVSDHDIEFGKHCYEHARLAKENQLWSMNLA